jgi:hypothetical protein
LLAAIRSVFQEAAMEKMISRQLVHALRHAPSASGTDAQQITERSLARSLKPFGIKPRNVHVGKLRAKGYWRKDFDSASAT